METISLQRGCIIHIGEVVDGKQHNWAQTFVKADAYMTASPPTFNALDYYSLYTKDPSSYDSLKQGPKYASFVTCLFRLGELPELGLKVFQGRLAGPKIHGRLYDSKEESFDLSRVGHRRIVGGFVEPDSERKQEVYDFLQARIVIFGAPLEVARALERDLSIGREIFPGYDLIPTSMLFLGDEAKKIIAESPNLDLPKA